MNPTTSSTMKTIDLPTMDLLHELNPQRGLDTLMLPAGVLRQLQELIEEQLQVELLHYWQLKPRHRLLLIGPPGNGKTSVAQALAYDLMTPLLVVRYDSLIGSYLGETAERLGKVFEHASRQRCVLFFDEFDTVGKERGDVNETGEIKRVVSTLLLQIDRLPKHVVVVAATNHAELLDTAVWRRFELLLRLPPPGPREIDAFVSVLFAGLKSAGRFKMNEIGKQLEGATYSEIEDLFRNVSRRVVLNGANAEPQKILENCVADWKRRAAVSPDPIQ